MWKRYSIDAKFVKFDENSYSNQKFVKFDENLYSNPLLQSFAVAGERMYQPSFRLLHPGKLSLDHLPPRSPHSRHNPHPRHHFHQHFQSKTPNIYIYIHIHIYIFAIIYRHNIYQLPVANIWLFKSRNIPYMFFLFLRYK